MKKLTYLLLFVLAIISCQSEDPVLEVDSTLEDDVTLNQRIDVIHVYEDGNCDDRVASFLSDDGNTGVFSINTTLNIYKGGNIDDPYSCNYINITGKYNKSERRLENIKTHYYKQYILLGEVRVKYVISKTDITWMSTENGGFRINFTMDRILERSNQSGIEDSHYPNTDDDDENAHGDYSADQSSGTYGVADIISESKKIDFIVD